MFTLFTSFSTRTMRKAMELQNSMCQLRVGAQSAPVSAAP
jgi:hypothetical protein